MRIDAPVATLIVGDEEHGPERLGRTAGAAFGIGLVHGLGGSAGADIGRNGYRDRRLGHVQL